MKARCGGMQVANLPKLRVGDGGGFDLEKWGESHTVMLEELHV